MDMQQKKAEKVLRQQQTKPKGRWKYNLYTVCFALVFFVLPFSLANFVDGGDELVEAALPFVVGLIGALLINWIRWSKHITAVESDNADRSVKKDDIQISYRYDQFTYTS